MTQRPPPVGVNVIAGTTASDISPAGFALLSEHTACLRNRNDFSGRHSDYDRPSIRSRGGYRRDVTWSRCRRARDNGDKECHGEVSELHVVWCDGLGWMRSLVDDAVVDGFVNAAESQLPITFATSTTLSAPSIISGLLNSLTAPCSVAVVGVQDHCYTEDHCDNRSADGSGHAVSH
jgi:hypothetical protein